jgi:hypothetical protein
MARLLSLNVGLPREVTWNGKTVRTAVWKFPVEGRRMVRKLNVDGHAQADLAGHGGEQRACSFTRWALTVTGSAFSAAMILLSVSSERTSPLRDLLTTRSALGIGTVLAMQYLK